MCDIFSVITPPPWKHYKKITIPIIRLVLQNFALPGCFPYIIFYSCLFLLNFSWLFLSLLQYMAILHSMELIKVKCQCKLMQSRRLQWKVLMGTLKYLCFFFVNSFLKLIVGSTYGGIWIFKCIGYNYTTYNLRLNHDTKWHAPYVLVCSYFICFSIRVT